MSYTVASSIFRNMVAVNFFNMLDNQTVSKKREIPQWVFIAENAVVAEIFAENIISILLHKPVVFL